MSGCSSSAVRHTSTKPARSPYQRASSSRSRNAWQMWSRRRCPASDRPQRTTGTALGVVVAAHRQLPGPRSRNSTPGPCSGGDSDASTHLPGDAVGRLDAALLELGHRRVQVGDLDADVVQAGPAAVLVQPRAGAARTRRWGRAPPGVAPAAGDLQPRAARAGVRVVPAGRGAEPEHLLQQRDLRLQVGHQPVRHGRFGRSACDSSCQLGCGSIQSYSLSTSSLTSRRL